jgi:tight adherence protein B
MAELSGLLSALAALLLVGPIFMFSRHAIDRIQAFLQRSAEEDWSAIFLFLDGRMLLLIYTGLALSSGVMMSGLGAPPQLTTIVVLGCLLVPKVTLHFLRKRREEQLTRQLPDMLLGIANGMRSGAGFQGALEIAVREGLPPLAQELAIILKELRMGTPLTTAFRNFETRYPTEEIRLLSAAVTINKEVGGSLSDVLLTLGDTLRRKIEMRGKIEALTAQGRMQGYVMTALPGLIAFAVFQLEPTTMSYLFSSVWGWMVIGIAGVMLFLGSIFIRKIVSFDV